MLKLSLRREAPVLSKEQSHSSKMVSLKQEDFCHLSETGARTCFITYSFLRLVVLLLKGMMYDVVHVWGGIWDCISCLAWDDEVLK